MLSSSLEQIEARFNLAPALQTNVKLSTGKMTQVKLEPVKEVIDRLYRYVPQVFNYTCQVLYFLLFACPSQPLVFLGLDESLLLRLETAILSPLLRDHVTFPAQRPVRAFPILVVRSRW